MDLLDLEVLKTQLRMDTLKVMCTGEILVDYNSLEDLQLLESGRSLKLTDDKKIMKLAKSLLRFGIVNNLQVWIDEKENVFCFDAHHRKKALALLAEIGLEIPRLPATRCLAATKTEAKKLLILKESRTSWIDSEVVADYLREVNLSYETVSSTIDLPEFTWEEVLDAEEDKEKDDGRDNQTPEIPEESCLKVGDLIELGDHRLLCGDSTAAEQVQRLMNGQQVDMVFTDPPYGIDVVQSNQVGGGGDPNNGGYAFGGVKNTGRIGGGNIRPSKVYRKIEGDQTTEIAESFYKCCLDLGFDNIILWGGNYFTDFLPPSRCWVIWDKEMTGNFSQAEMAWTSFTKGGVKIFKFLWNGLSREGKRKEELKSRVHPTQKPVGLFSNIFKDFDDFKTIYDGFLGSGSTLMACEKTGRKCFGMEIDPLYCQVIVQRWCDFTESDTVRINGHEKSWTEYSSQ